MQQLLQVCEEGKVRDVDGVLEKWNKDNHNCNEVNEVCSYLVATITSQIYTLCPIYIGWQDGFHCGFRVGSCKCCGLTSGGRH